MQLSMNNKIKEVVQLRPYDTTVLPYSCYLGRVICVLGTRQKLTHSVILVRCVVFINLTLSYVHRLMYYRLYQLTQKEL